MSFVFPKRSCAGAFVHSAFSAPPVWDSLYILHDFLGRVKEIVSLRCRLTFAMGFVLYQNFPLLPRPPPDLLWLLLLPPDLLRLPLLPLLQLDSFWILVHLRTVCEKISFETASVRPSPET